MTRLKTPILWGYILFVATLEVAITWQIVEDMEWRVARNWPLRPPLHMLWSDARLSGETRALEPPVTLR